MSSIPRRAAGSYLQWRFDHWTTEQIAHHQRRRGDRLAHYLLRHSPYYAQRVDTSVRPNLAAFPVMNKAEMMANFDAINTVGLHRDELVAFRIEQERAGKTELFEGRYSIGLSSGTSGNKVLTVLSPWERVRYSSLLWARSGVPRDLEHPRVLFTLRTNNPAFTAVTALGVHLVYADYFVPLDELVQTINIEQLNVLAGPPSLLAALAERHDSITSRIEGVVSYAEELDDTDRDRIASAFHAPVAQLYQGAEGMLGFTCPAGLLHLNEDCSLVEFADAGDSIGTARKVIITDLYRRAQPFVRYELNDLIELDDSGDPCPCGSAFRRIRRIHGRADSIIQLPGVDGGQVPLMPDYVRRSVNQASADILEYQVVQWSLDDIEVRLHLRDGSDREGIEQAVRRNLDFWAARAGGHTALIRFSDTLPQKDPTSHKLVRVINRIGR